LASLWALVFRGTSEAQADKALGDELLTLLENTVHTTTLTQA
jgi:hypothetical protein